MLDPSVGCWLLQPDSCFDSFGDCVKLMGTRDEGVAAPAPHHGSSALLLQASVSPEYMQISVELPQEKKCFDFLSAKNCNFCYEFTDVSGFCLYVDYICCVKILF